MYIKRPRSFVVDGKRVGQLTKGLLKVQRTFHNTFKGYVHLRLVHLKGLYPTLGAGQCFNGSTHGATSHTIPRGLGTGMARCCK